MIFLWFYNNTIHQTLDVVFDYVLLLLVHKVLRLTAGSQILGCS